MEFKGYYDNIIFDKNKRIPNMYEGTQGDTKSRGLYVTVSQDTEKVELTGETMRAYIEKPDEKRVLINAVKEGNAFRIDYTNQVFAAPGIAEVMLDLIGENGESLASRTFKLAIYESLLENSIVSEDERGILDKAFEFAEDLIPRIELIEIDFIEEITPRLEALEIDRIEDIEQRLLAIDIVTVEDLIGRLEVFNIVDVEEMIAKLNALDIDKLQDIEQRLLALDMVGIEELVARIELLDLDHLDGFIARLTALDIDLLEELLPRLEVLDIEFLEEIIPRIELIDVELLENVQKELNLVKSELELKADKSDMNEKLELKADKVKVSEELELKADKIDTDKKLELKVDKLKLEEDLELKADKSDMNEKLELKADKLKLEEDLELKADKLKVLQLEKELKDYKNTMQSVNINQEAKHSVKGGSIISLPKNTGEGAIDLSMKGLTATNLVENGDYFEGTKSVQLPKRIKSVDEDGLKETIAYINAKDEEDNSIELRSLPNGVRDEIVDRKLIKRIGKGELGEGIFKLVTLSISNEFTEVYRFDKLHETDSNSFYIPSRFPVNYGERGNKSSIGGYNVFTTGVYVWLIFGKGTTLEQANSEILGEEVYYQLETPIEIPLQTSGNLIGYPNGTVYIENADSKVGIYTDKFEVDLPIKELENVEVIDYSTGTSTYLDLDKAVITGNAFTHEDLKATDIVFVEYAYDLESTVGQNSISYYDSRYTIKDAVTEKFYKWNIEVSNGTPTIKLEEV